MNALITQKLPIFKIVQKLFENFTPFSILFNEP